VILRQALRDVLGPEKSLEDHVLYSQFSWYVWENILSPDDPEAVKGSAEEEGRATDRPRLAILPARVQRKGFAYLSNNVDLLMSMVRAAENGIDRESLDQQIAEDAPGLKVGSRTNALSQGPALGVLTFENGTYRPTPAGRALLEGDEPSEVITPVMVRTVFGFAQILDDLGRNDTMTRVQIAETCRVYYPRWTADFAPNSLISWMRDLGLIEIDGAGATARIKLTETGDYWRSGLPDDIKIPALLLTDSKRGFSTLSRLLDAQLAF